MDDSEKMTDHDWRAIAAWMDVVDADRAAMKAQRALAEARAEARSFIADAREELGDA
ncbi:hypothetical protein [Nocardia wallacei]|uniref:hypothetical protein n=1 Tax=Nocardia wallacei TaxID=480035 RepID=UPI0024582796|nr:hypothetical protein [Nocardia wallacei]